MDTNDQLHSNLCIKPWTDKDISWIRMAQLEMIVFLSAGCIWGLRFFKYFWGQQSGKKWASIN